MSYLLTCSSFNYYMVSTYVKYMPGDIFSNQIAMGLSEIVAVVTAGLLQQQSGFKKSLTAMFILAALGSYSIHLIGAENQEWMPLLVTITKFGIAGAFKIIYLSSTEVFPVLFVGTASGVCNTVARSLTIGAPVLAEQDAPMPLIVFQALALGGILATQFIRSQPKLINKVKTD
jgi:hypothetical protein